MKFLVSLFCSFICISLVAQTSDELAYRLNLYQEWKDSHYQSKVCLDSTGFSQLPIKERQNGPEAFDPDYVHLVDLNQDGMKDLISTQPDPIYFYVSVYINRGDRMEFLYSNPGSLLAEYSSKGKSIIQIIKPDCCCDYFNNLIQISIDKNSNIQENYISFRYGTEIEKDLAFKDAYYSGTLRWAPVENDSLGKDPCTEEPIIGNHLTKLEKQKLIVLKEVGIWKQVWYLMWEESSLIGWIKVEE